MRERWFFCLLFCFVCVCVFNKCFFFVGIYYGMLVAEKHPLPPLKEKFTMIQIFTRTLISQITVELKWAPSVLDTGEEGHYGCCLGRAISPRHWWRSTLSGNLAYTKDVEGSLQLSLGCPKLDWFICWVLLCLCKREDRENQILQLAKV